MSEDQGPHPLDYQGQPSRTSTTKSPNVVSQMLAGAGAWVVVLLVTVMVMRDAGSRAIYVLPFSLLAIGCWAYQMRARGWRLFLAGVMIGFAMTCLLPVGIVYVYCSNHPFN